MSQAKDNHTRKALTRRSAIALVGASTVAAGSTAVALSAVPDPIFAVLDAHSRATDRERAAIHSQGEAGDAIPESQLEELRDAHNSWGDAVYDLLTTMPTTMAGLTALLVRLGRIEFVLEKAAGDSLDESVYTGATRTRDGLSDAAFSWFERLAEHLRTTPLTA